MTQNQALHLHSILEKDDPLSPIEAANWFYEEAGSKDKCTDLKQANTVIYSIFQLMLDSGEYTQAALLLWGDKVFNPHPKSVQRIWDGLKDNNKLLLVGGGAQGKSMTPAAWAVLWWSQDPKWTSIKVVSVTATHAAANMMASIRSFHESSVIKLPGRAIENIIDMGDGNKRSSIALISIPQGEDIKGRLKGFHTVPRGYIHPLFGPNSRMAIIIDEGEDVPVGIWEGLDNVLSEDGGQGNIKIVSGANPKKRESPFCARCEFPGGWTNFDLETSDEWIGPASLGSWKVVRLDPAKSENVVEKKGIFQGFMTYEGFMNYVRKGQNSPDYFTFARGAWPESSAEYRITPTDFFNNSRGTLVFASDVVPIASLDPAFSEGGDNAVLTTGRYGTAIGFQPVTGGYEQWTIPHKAIQLEQQFNVPKANTLIMAQDVIKYIRHLKVRPEWFCIDRTGNGHGLYDAIRMQFGDILGQQWGEKSSETKILEEDSMKASELYYGVNTEMMFAFAQWLQYGYIKFAPMMDIAKLTNQAINRKYYFQAGLMRAESKNDYKRTSSGTSPDEYDSAIMMVHVVRTREAQRAQMLPTAQIRQDLREVREDKTEYGVIDRIEFISPLT